MMEIHFHNLDVGGARDYFSYAQSIFSGIDFQ